MSIQYRRLEFTRFPRVWGTIIIPKNFIVYRSGTRPPILSTDPRFFSDFDNANIYTKVHSNYQNYACVLKELKLMDLRSMKYLFLEYVAHNKLWFSDQEFLIVEKALFALGLMSIHAQYDYIQKNPQYLDSWAKKFPSLDHVYYDMQCHLLQGSPADLNRYNIDRNLTHLTMYGSRISSCAIDDDVVALLKILFGDTVDGYIAPAQETVWHNYNFHPELCLFDPSKSLLSFAEVPAHITNPDAVVPPYSINDILLGYTSPLNTNDLLRGGTRDGITFTAECKLPEDKEKDKIATEQIANMEQNFAYEAESSSSIADVWQHAKNEEDRFEPKMVKQDVGLFNKIMENSSKIERISNVSKSLPNSANSKTNSKRSNMYGLHSEML